MAVGQCFSVYSEIIC